MVNTLPSFSSTWHRASSDPSAQCWTPSQIYMPDMQCDPHGKDPVGQGRCRQSSSEASSQSACPLHVKDRLIHWPVDRHYVLFIYIKTWSLSSLIEKKISNLKCERMATGIVISALMVLHNTLAYAIQTSGIRISCFTLEISRALLSKTYSIVKSRLTFS